jgi:uncharacterized damage-inducible protein DinB
MNLADIFRAEFASDIKKTRRALERVPDGKFDWKPHEKSFSLIQLAWHVAEIYDWGAAILGQDEFAMRSDEARPPQPKTTAELLERFDKHAAASTAVLAKVDDDALAARWKMTFDGNPFVDDIRHKVFRDWVFSHAAHHRGQLTVYLRLLNVPVPALFGPSADEQ